MCIRPVLALIMGALVWALLFPALVGLAMLSWPALHDTVTVFNQTHRYSVFTATSMLLLFQLFWVITNTMTGFVTGLIARRIGEVLIITVLLVGYFAYLHFFAYWDQFPAWYNLLVVAIAVPALLFGGVTGATARRKPQPAPAM